MKCVRTSNFSCCRISRSWMRNPQINTSVSSLKQYNITLTQMAKRPIFFGNNFNKICHSDSSEVRYEQLNQRAAFTMKTRSSFEQAATTWHNVQWGLLFLKSMFLRWCTEHFESSRSWIWRKETYFVDCHWCRGQFMSFYNFGQSIPFYCSKRVWIN